MIALKKLHCVKEKFNMNKGTESLKQVLNILDNMGVEEYEKLYDEVCEQYGDTEPLCVLDDSFDIHSLSAQMYNADNDIKLISQVAFMSNVCDYTPKDNRDGIPEHSNMVDTMFTKIKQVFNMNIQNDFSNIHENKVKSYVYK